VALFVYAIAFAFAYAAIPAGTGALLLFAAIQISMILYGITIGERLSLVQSVGFAFAIGGLILLMLPSLGAPPLVNAAFMILSGIAWSVYSLIGRKSKDPVAATAGNFIRAAPIAIVFFVVIYSLSGASYDMAGVSYGLGYILWYAALKELNVTHAATVQLSVPVITAFGGALFLSEPITQILVVASAAIVIGISLVVLTKKKARQPEVPVPLPAVLRPQEIFEED
jgi:drug/metabolite transporter (DMT)-like permease